MRPPSYYASIVKSNSSNASGRPYGSDYDSPAFRTSSQQLRESISSPSSLRYASRSHLPFVAQSSLVAHCFTGATSSAARPSYSGGTGLSSTSSSITSTTTSSRDSVRNSSYISSTATLSSPFYATSSREPSTKRTTSPPSRTTYYSSLSGVAMSTSRYRPVTASAYYKPIRLRERPLLTQISRQVQGSQQAVAVKDSTAPPSHSLLSESAGHRRPESVVADEEEEDEASSSASNQRALKERAANWSTDIGRNISRNKYLIKFRELDRPVTPAIGASERKNEPGSDEDDRLCGDSSKLIAVPEQPPSSVVDEAAVLHKVLPSPANGEADRSQDEDRLQIGQTEQELCKAKLGAETEPDLAATAMKEPKKGPIKKERKNVKLKLRPLGAKSEGVAKREASATTATQTVIVANKSDGGGALKSRPKMAVANEAQISQQAAKVLQTPPRADAYAKENVAVPTIAMEVSPNEDSSKQERAKVRVKKKAQAKASTTKTEAVAERGVAQAPTNIQPQSSEWQSSPIKAAKPLATRRQSSADSPVTASTRSLAVESKQAAPGRIRFRAYNYDDFNFLTVLGHGGWGFVLLAELKEHDACFAVKCIKKITIVEDDDYESIMIERKVLTLGNLHPFICKLFCTFETAGYLFFVMEYCAGGDLMFHVQHEGKFTESRCRFYAAEIICAIRFLHNRHIIYRDLKLDNILLDSEGHVRLVDFGMCQCRTYREEMLPSNFCGTPEYISPEIIKGVPYNHSVDWWSFGVLLYEMAVGKMPFRGSDENELLWNVCYEQIHYPMFLSKELSCLLKLLLEREPAKRMGMATCKAGGIQDQPFFRGVDWKAVEALRVEPPFKPEVKSNRDVSNFDSDFTESACELSPVDESTLKRIDQTQFQEFPFTNPDTFIFDAPAAGRTGAGLRPLA